MRFMTARLSAKRRSRFAGPVVMLFALLVTGGVYAVFSPASTASSSSSTDDVSKGRALFLVGCASCHGKNGEGITSRTAASTAPPWSASAPPRSTSRSAPAGCRWRRPARRPRSSRRVYTAEETSLLAAYVATLGPGPSIPTSDKYSPDAIPESEREEAIVRGGSSSGPTARPATTSPQPAAPSPAASTPPAWSASSRSTSTRPWSPARSRCRSSPTTCSRPTRSATSSPSSRASRPTPSYGGSQLGSLGPVSEGLFAWLAGIGVLVGFAIWIASHTARTTRKGAKA